MGRFEFLRIGGGAATGLGIVVAGGAVMVELLGLPPEDPVPEVFNWVEGAGCVAIGLGLVGLAAYKIANPSWPEDDRDHWRNGY